MLLALRCFGDVNDPTTTVTFTTAGTVTANFAAPSSVSVTFTTGGTGTGTVNPSGAGSYTIGVPFDITATPTGASTFSGWAFAPGSATFGDVNDPTTTVTFTTAGTVTANFAAPILPAIYVSAETDLHPTSPDIGSLTNFANMQSDTATTATLAEADADAGADMDNPDKR